MAAGKKKGEYSWISFWVNCKNSGLGIFFGEGQIFSGILLVWLVAEFYKFHEPIVLFVSPTILIVFFKTK